MQEKKEFVVNGFQFNNLKDAEAARNEQDKVKLLDSRLDYEHPDQVRIIYEKAIQNRIFKTPIGYTYLHTLQKYLEEHATEGEEVRSIPLFVNYVNSMRSATAPARQRIVPKKPEPEPAEKRLKVSRVINIVLTGVILLMFVIAMTGQNPNILNYENNLVNKYSAWEQELTEREKIVREKEKSLDIAPPEPEENIKEESGEAVE